MTPILTGLDDKVCAGVLKNLSGGQKSRVLLAAALWTLPHLLCLDEPTNFLDKETFNALVRALNSFKGAVLTISHNQDFVEKVFKRVFKYCLNKSSIACVCVCVCV